MWGFVRACEVSMMGLTSFFLFFFLSLVALVEVVVVTALSGPKGCMTHFHSLSLFLSLTGTRAMAGGAVRDATWEGGLLEALGLDGGYTPPHSTRQDMSALPLT
jgi:hypothetical protein